MPSTERYKPAHIREVLNKTFPKDQGKSHNPPGGISVPAYYQNEKAVILDPVTDDSLDQTFQSLAQGLKALGNNLNNKILLIPLAEQKKILGLFKRNHWVTLHYNPATNTATLIDSRPRIVSFLYPRKAIKQALINWVGTHKTPFTFQTIYQSVQHNDIHCGAWTSQNILDLSDNGTDEALKQQKIRYQASQEQQIVGGILQIRQALDTSSKQADKPATEKEQPGLFQRLLRWLGLAKSPEPEQAPDTKSSTSTIMQATGGHPAPAGPNAAADDFEESFSAIGRGSLASGDFTDLLEKEEEADPEAQSSPSPGGRPG